MSELERGSLIPVSGPNDRPDTDDAIAVQFNPSSLKVALANTLKANGRDGGTRAAQFVDKSSSNLTVELIFDTTDDGSDVRQRTKVIAETFLKPVGSGDQMRAPRRCLFQWGAFEFLGLLQSFDETLDFFSPEGRPLRASVSLKLTEDRFQFRTREVDQAERATPTLVPTGANPAAGPQAQDGEPVTQANTRAGRAQRDWRETALANGVETPRLPPSADLAVPQPGRAARAAAPPSPALNSPFSGAFTPTSPDAGRLLAERGIGRAPTGPRDPGSIGFD